MRPVFPGTSTAALIALMLGLVLFTVRFVQPEWGALRAVRAAIAVVFGAMFAGVGMWAAGRAVGDVRLVHGGAGIAYAGVLAFLPAVAILPFAAALNRFLLRVVAPRPSALPALGPSNETKAPIHSGWAHPLRRGPGPGPGPAPLVSRRALVHFGSASLPTLAAVTSASGFVTAKRPPKTPLVTMQYPHLHPDLEGLRILQLSDLHLGAGLTLDDLDSGLARARALAPDLIVLTGDLADAPSLIAPALERVHAFGARYGALACLGNHEYLHGIDVTRPLYEKSKVPLLVSTGRTLRIGRAQLFVGGVDDPVHMGGDIAWMLGPSLEGAAAAAPPDADFRLLLCHRPEGFDRATDLGFDLTLSGHTHGGQLGFLGRSLLEKIRPEVRWWGTYERARPSRRAVGTPNGPGRLYTTSGFGQWFPFRLGCPTEMPLIVLSSTGGSNGLRSRVAARRS